MKNTRVLKVGEPVTVEHAGRGTSQGLVTENNPASCLIYVDGRPYERCDVSPIVR
jgi:hypothetical protein